VFKTTAEKKRKKKTMLQVAAQFFEEDQLRTLQVKLAQNYPSGFRGDVESRYV
jgi:hypothetical protein